MAITQILSDATRMAVGIVFLLSSIGKLQDPRGFLAGVTEYRILSPKLSLIFGILLMPAGGLVGIALIAAVKLDIALSVSLGLLLIFSVAIIANLRQGRSPACHCFGAGSSERISRRSLARLSLIALGLFVVLLVHKVAPPSTQPGIPQYIRDAFLNLTIALFLLATGSWLLATPELWHIVRREFQRPGKGG